LSDNYSSGTNEKSTHTVDNKKKQANKQTTTTTKNEKQQNKQYFSFMMRSVLSIH